MENSWLTRFDKKFPETVEVIKTGELAEFFSVSEQTIRNMCFTMEIEAVKICSRWKITREAARRYVSEQI